MVASLRLAFETDRVMRLHELEEFMTIIRGGDDCDIGCDRVDRGDAHEASCQVGVTFITAGAVPRRQSSAPLGLLPRAVLQFRRAVPAVLRYYYNNSIRLSPVQ